jgi:hypothetical protein
VGVFHRLGERVDLSRRRARLSRAASSAAVEKQESRVTPSPSRRRTTLSAAVLLVLALGASACGGNDDPKTTDDPSQTASATPTPTPTPTPSPTPTPLSPFEDRPQVQALRSWAAAVGQDINAHDPSMPRSARYETDHGQEAIPQYAAEDMQLYYPGPAPFTPVAVTVSGRSATVSVCWMSQGWAEDPTTHKRARKRKVDPAAMTMRKEHGTWLLDDLRYAKVDCSGVIVKGVHW